jgi:hypothetical protein
MARNFGVPPRGMAPARTNMADVGRSFCGNQCHQRGDVPLSPLMLKAPRERERIAPDTTREQDVDRGGAQAGRCALACQEPREAGLQTA